MRSTRTGFTDYPLPDKRLLFRHGARRALAVGAETAARLVRATLGPVARNVAIQPLTGDDRTPEFLDDAGTILRRVIELPDKWMNMGVMLIRQLAWRVKDEVGDGTATAVVIADAIARESFKYVEAGGNPMMIRRGVERGLAVALECLDEIKTPITSQEEITQVAVAATGNEEMGRLLGEMFDIVGAEGTISVEETQRAQMDRRYIEGVSWDKGFISPYMVTDQERMEANLDSPVILICDHWLKEASQLVPLMQRLIAAGEKNLFIVGNDIEGDALSLLVTNKLHNRLTTVAVKAPGYGDRRGKILEDLAVLVDARVLSQEAGNLIEDVQISDLGRAQRVWVNKDFFSIIGGAGDPQKLRDRIADVKKDIKWYKEKKEEYEYNKALERLGKLSGGAAVLTVGAASEADMKLLKLKAEDGVRTVRAAIEDGIVPGGGVALLACSDRVRGLSADGDERVGVQILARALEEPLRRIVLNAGYEDAPIIAQIRESGPGFGYDVRSGAVVRMVDAGIYDPCRVVRCALETAVSGALMLITTETLILRRQTMYDVAANP